MRTLLISLLGLLVFRAVTLADIGTDISKTNRVILKSGAWIPTAAETQKAMVAIQSFLESSSSTNNLNSWEFDGLKKIRESTKENRVQFYGSIREGRKVIWCNFIPVPQSGKEDAWKSWKQNLIFGDDGGFRFWQINYDLGTGKCSNFNINANG